MCLAAPWATRVLLLGEKRLRVIPADVRGLLADGSVALAVVGIMGLAMLAGRRWGRALAWIVMASFVVLSFAIYEIVSAFDSLHALSHFGLAADPVFLGGSVRHMRHPILLGLLLLLGTACLWRAGPPSRSWWAGWAVAFGSFTLGYAALPVTHRYDEWRQRHAVHAQAAMIPVRAGKGLGTVGAEALRAFEQDLGGERWVGPLRDRPNVLLIMVEAASGASLPLVSKRDGVETSAPMPKLGQLARDHVVFTHVVAHQRQTNRGEYAILCGDYPKLLTDQSKMSEQVYGPARRCLPAVLRDAGYLTAYIQAAPLGYMLKDQFMPRAGFDRLVGDAALEKSYARTDWGVDDAAFYEQALPYLEALHGEEDPFFATLLTVGTHHPFTFPASDGVEGSEKRRAEAFAYADRALARFVAALGERGILDDTVVIITSDESMGLVRTTKPQERLLAQSWSFAVVLLPAPQAKRIDVPVGHVDVATSVVDLLGIDSPTPFIGRSWFRDYDTPRPLFAGNTYARRAIMWREKTVIICDERFRDCRQHPLKKDAIFTPKPRAKPAPPRERRVLAEVARLTRTPGAIVAGAYSMRLLTADEVRVRAADGKKLLAGGQYLRVPAGSTVHVVLDLAVEGDAGEVKLHQNVFIRGYERFSRPDVILRSGQRWRLVYDLGVRRDADQLVVQLYATTVTSDEVTIRFNDAVLAVDQAGKPPRGAVVIEDEVTPSRAR